MTFTPKSKTSINERQAGILVQVCLSPNPTPLSHTVYGVKDSPRRLAWQVACESHTIVVRRDGCIVLMDYGYVQVFRPCLWLEFTKDSLFLGGLLLFLTSPCWSLVLETHSDPLIFPGAPISPFSSYLESPRILLKDKRDPHLPCSPG